MFLIVILPLFAASIMLLVNMRETVREKALSTAMSSADSLKYRLIDIVESSESILNIFISDRSIIEFLDNDFSDINEYYKYYNSNSHLTYLRAAPQIADINVYTERSDFVYNYDYIFADENIIQTQWYSKAVDNDQEFVWDIVRTGDEGEYYLSCSKAIVSNGNVVGVLNAMISDDWLEKFIYDAEYNTILCVNNGIVYYSNYPGATEGGVIEFDDSITKTGYRDALKEGFLGFKGYAIAETFNYGTDYQIILLLPTKYADYELNRLSIIYGGYFCLFIILSVLIIFLFTSVFSRRITLLSEKMHTVAGGNFNVNISDEGNDEITALYTDLNQMINSMQTLMNDVYQAKIQNEEFKFVQMEAEFKALASQINPHFLYNTLETIRMKAFCNNDKETADLVKKLGKFMRRCLEFKDGEVTLRSELEFTNGYLELQSARFGDRVSYSIYSEVSKDYMILPLIIQPVVENAFVHGIEGCKNNGRIDVKVYYSGENVIIDVKDNGIGMDDKKLAELKEKLRINDTSSGKSIGLTNVNKRIKMYHGEQYGMSIKTKQGVGTTIRITLPRKPVERKTVNIQLKENRKV